MELRRTVRLYVILSISLLFSGCGKSRAPVAYKSPQLSVKHSLRAIVAPDGRLWTWGTTEVNGKRLDGKEIPAETPSLLTAETEWVEVAQGRDFLVAVKADGSLWGMGQNKDGQLLLPRGFLTTLTLISSEKVWKNIWAGETHCLGLKKDGTLWAWGSNGYSQCGPDAGNAAPAQIPGRNWLSAGAGTTSSYGLKSDGTVWGWGQIYLSLPASSLPSMIGCNRKETPKQRFRTEDGMLVTESWRAISAGDFHLTAINSDGSLWVAGPNAGLAAPSADVSSALGAMGFTSVSSETNWVEIHSGKNYFLARRSDGTWAEFGDNAFGQLGRSPIDAEETGPDQKRFGDLQIWAVGCGSTTTLIFCTDDTLWACGTRIGGRSQNLVDSTKSLINKGASVLHTTKVFTSERPESDWFPTFHWKWNR